MQGEGLEGRWWWWGELSAADTDSEVRFDALHSTQPSPWLPSTCAIDVSNHITRGFRGRKANQYLGCVYSPPLTRAEGGAAGTSGGAGRLKQVGSDDSSSRKQRSCLLMFRRSSDETDEKEDRCAGIQKKKKQNKKMCIWTE